MKNFIILLYDKIKSESPRTYRTHEGEEKGKQALDG
jgi:hypothetical protein